MTIIQKGERMSDLISRQAAIDAMLGDKVEITNVIRAIGNERDFEVLNTTCDRHAKIIKALPTVQPNHNAEVSKMEIIHCKDCKFARMTVSGECEYCDIWFPDDKTYMPGDYYCASAEKRGEADDEMGG